MCSCMGQGCKYCLHTGENFARPFSVESVPYHTVQAAPKGIEIRHVARVSSDRVSVRVAIPVKEWSDAKRKGALGQLYGTDISNFIYHATAVHAYQPTVDDRARASGGVKVIELIYTDTEWAPAPKNVIHVDFINRRRVA